MIKFIYYILKNKHKNIQKIIQDQKDMDLKLKE